MYQIEILDGPEFATTVNTAFAFLKENSMCNNVRFVLDNLEFEYINVRVDMRTSTCLMSCGYPEELPIYFRVIKVTD